MNSPEAVLRQVFNIATGHPSKSVRDLAMNLGNELEAFYSDSSIRRNRIEEFSDDDEPGLEMARLWQHQIESIVEAIHTPEPQLN